MLDALKFVQGAVASRDIVPVLTHFDIGDGCIIGYNGVVALGSPINLDIQAKPQAKSLIKAIQACEETIAIHLTEAGKLHIKSGAFQIAIECTAEPFPEISIEGLEIPLPENFLSVITKLQPFISEDASRIWSQGIRFFNQSAFATNNIALVEHWLDFIFPIAVNIPKPAIAELVRIKQAPTSIVIGDTACTFLYPGDRWLRTQLYSTEWPKVENVLNQDSNQSQFPQYFFYGLKKLLPFTDKLKSVYFAQDAISTDNDPRLGATISCPGISGNGCFSGENLIALEGVADTIDFSSYPKPCLFYGDKIRGAIIGKIR